MFSILEHRVSQGKYVELAEVMIMRSIKILYKLVQLISRNLIGVNVELYYGIMAKENLRKEGLN